MDIAFRKSKLGKTFNSAANLNRAYGKEMARVIMNRMAVLEAAANLALAPETPPERRHQLKGKRADQYAVDLAHPKRLVFVPDHDPVPHRDDGGVDLDLVKAIMILEVVDYH